MQRPKSLGTSASTRMIVTYVVAMVKTSSACADSYIGEYIVWLLAGGQGKPEGRSARPGRGERARGEPPLRSFQVPWFFWRSWPGRREKVPLCCYAFVPLCLRALPSRKTQIVPPTKSDVCPFVPLCLCALPPTKPRLQSRSQHAVGISSSCM